MIKPEFEKGSEPVPNEAIAREDFLASLAYFAHEARAPLTAMRETLHWVAESESATPAVTRACIQIQEQILSLLRLLDEIGDTEPRGLDLWMEPVDLVQIVEGAIEMMRPMFEAKSQLVLSVLGPSPVWVRGDPMRLTQVFRSLLENGSKFSPSHSRVEVSSVRIDGNAAVSFRDQGIGLETNDLEQIFDLESRIESIDPNDKIGSGIGLALANRLVKMHGGTIEVFSQGVGRGSEFVVLLPLAPQTSSS